MAADTPETPPLFSLPKCLVRKISKFITTADQACLSLSCKFLFELFHSSGWWDRIDEEIRLCPFYDKTWNIEFTRPTRLLPRNQLLVQLENSKWAFCAECQKLHLREEFEASGDGVDDNDSEDDYIENDYYSEEEEEDYDDDDDDDEYDEYDGVSVDDEQYEDYYDDDKYQEPLQQCMAHPGVVDLSCDDCFSLTVS